MVGDDRLRDMITKVYIPFRLTDVSFSADKKPAARNIFFVPT